MTSVCHPVYGQSLFPGPSCVVLTCRWTWHKDLQMRVIIWRVTVKARQLTRPPQDEHGTSQNVFRTPGRSFCPTGQARDRSGLWKCREIDESFACRTNRIQYEERGVPQPEKRIGRSDSYQVKSVKGIADDLCCCPREDHTSVERGGASGGITFDYGPDRD